MLLSSVVAKNTTPLGCWAESRRHRVMPIIIGDFRRNIDYKNMHLLVAKCMEKAIASGIYHAYFKHRSTCSDPIPLPSRLSLSQSFLSTIKNHAITQQANECWQTYSKTCLKRTPTVQKNLSALDRCPPYRGYVRFE